MSTNDNTNNTNQALWLDPCGGMAGDMFLAGLLDLEQPEFTLAHLRELAEELLPGEAQLEESRVLRQGLAARHLAVRTPETDTIPHRNLAELRDRIGTANLLGPAAKERAIAVLQALADAEGAVHCKDPETIHFHEVGAVDTLIDVGGAALAWQQLGPATMYVRPPLLGSGTVQCAHGVLPVPPPATAKLLEGHPTRPGGGGGERVTPTGAAIMASWGRFEDPTGVWTAHASGYGAGTRDPKRKEGPANLLRVSLISAAESGGARSAGKTAVWQMEVNLDDITAQDLGACQAALWKAGAVDVWMQSIQMKKQRPGTLVAALVLDKDRKAVEAALFHHTPTFGVRWLATERTECERRFDRLRWEGREVRIKLRLCPDNGAPNNGAAWQAFPEFDDLVALAEALERPVWWVRQECLRRYAEQQE